jgi:hypothetical protein
MQHLLNFSDLFEDFSVYLSDEDNLITEKSNTTESLKKKSKASGIPLGILRKVYSKGCAAWNSGHRPGVSQQQWAMGRVNSFITGAGGARKADVNLWTQAKAAKARKKKK